MRTLQQLDQLREEAVALRLAGKSVREIRESLGPVGKRTLSAALDGTPPAEWTHRPNAKDDLRDRARELRTQGLSYNEIVAKLGVSKSSVSLWVRDVPCPERFRYVHNERRVEGLRKYNEPVRPGARQRRRPRLPTSTRSQTASCSSRARSLTGARARKNKPDRRSSDSVIVHQQRPEARRLLPSVLVRCRRATGVTSYSASTSTRTLTPRRPSGSGLMSPALNPSQFRSPTLKRHNPKTVRTKRRRGLSRVPEDRCAT